MNHEGTLQKPLVPVQEFASLLECFVCLKFMEDAIELCPEGHNMCSSCVMTLPNKECPQCGKVCAGTRNYLAEAFASKLFSPCDNHEFGCSHKVKIHDADTHKQICPFRLYKCLLKNVTGCTWIGRKNDMLEHFIEMHEQHICKDTKFDIDKGDFETEAVTYCLFPMDGEVFWYVLKVSSDTVFWCVQYIGPINRVPEFSCQFKLNDRNSSLVYTTTPNEDLEDIESILNTGHCLEMGVRMIKMFQEFTITILYKKVKK